MTKVITDHNYSFPYKLETFHFQYVSPTNSFLCDRRPMLSQPSAMQAMEATPPAATVIVSALINMQQKITELSDQLEANQSGNLAMRQLFLERSRKPAPKEELWGKVAACLDLTNSAWGLTSVFPKASDRVLISVTLAFAFIGDCFLTRQSLHDLFATLDKPTEEEVYSTTLPIIYSTIDEARGDLYVMTDAQFEFARKRPFVAGPESAHEKVKHLLTFIKQSQGLADPPHIRVEQPGTRTDIALESIGLSFFGMFFVTQMCFFSGKRMGPNVLNLWNSLLDLPSPGHFRMDQGEFVAIPLGDMEMYQHMPELKAAQPPVDERYARIHSAFQPLFERQAAFGTFGGRSCEAFPQHRFPFVVEDAYQAPRPSSTVQVSEVGPAPTPYEKFIQFESEEKHAALRDFYPGTLVALNAKEFNTLLRKFNAHSVKRARESQDEVERPVTRSQKGKSKKTRKSKKQKKDVVEDEAEEEAEEE